MTSEEPVVVTQLIERSRRLGSDPRNSNYGGGNTSAKGMIEDPTSGEEVEVMWVKGSGGDLGTLTAEGLSALRVDRVRALEKVYRGVEQEDEMQQLLDYCGFGTSDAAPSIDTSMHGLLQARHIDHLHPDSVIAIAAAADGEELTNQCFGDDVAWVPWRRPGFELALSIERLREQHPELKGVVMGGHGLTTWADTSDECEESSLDLIRRATEFLEREGREEPLGPLRTGFGPLEHGERRRQAAVLAPVIRGLAGTDGPVVGRWFQDDVVIDFIGRDAAPRVVPLGTSCPDHFIRTKVRPLLLDLPGSASLEERIERLKELHIDYRDEYRAYYDRHAD
ncbi:MAG: class II aldolase/adducin family protein, partial [Acidimicrobiia bacterium]